jgi:hypothetical protein
VSLLTYSQGRLTPGLASLVLLSSALLQWNFPAQAIGENLSRLAALLRAKVSSPGVDFLRR